MADNVDVSIKTFPIYHPDHDDAVCDARMWDEFKALGWSKTKPEAKPKDTSAK